VLVAGEASIYGDFGEGPASGQMASSVVRSRRTRRRIASCVENRVQEACTEWCGAAVIVGDGIATRPVVAGMHFIDQRSQPD
jgi:hypothetical protein